MNAKMSKITKKLEEHVESLLPRIPESDRHLGIGWWGGLSCDQCLVVFHTVLSDGSPSETRFVGDLYRFWKRKGKLSASQVHWLGLFYKRIRDKEAESCDDAEEIDTE